MKHYVTYVFVCMDCKQRDIFLIDTREGKQQKGTSTMLNEIDIE